MIKILSSIILGVTILACSGTKNPKPESDQIQNEYTWESLNKRPIPKWFDDAKFGIMIHWGPYSVIGHRKADDYAEWAPYHMYRDGESVFDSFFDETYGAHPPEFGYKDIIPLFKAEKWDPDAWAELFKEAGAKYVTLTAEHHDGYALWDSDLTDWCATKTGPMRDLVGDLGVAVRKKGLKYAPSYHRERHNSFFATEMYVVESQPLPDIAREIELMPEAAELYGPFELSDAFIKDYVARWQEIQTKYQPDFMWIDDVPIFYWTEESRNHPQTQKYRDAFLNMIGDYFNASDEWGKEVYLNNKGKNLNWPEGPGCLEMDNLKLDSIGEKWENPATLGSSYGYARDEEERDAYKSPTELVHLLCDVVSKNGNLLLNIGPRADGTIPEGMQKRLLAIGEWLKTNGEAIYGTRPWVKFKQDIPNLTATDVGNKETIGGLAREFYTRIGMISNFPPSLAESLFLEMLDEASVPVLFERCLESAEIKDGQLVSLTMETGETFKASVFVDATYEGDLLAAANVSYRVGREPQTAYNESLAGQWQKISWQTVYQFCELPLNPYVESGNSQSGLLAEIASEPAGNKGDGDYKVQAYNFRVFLTEDEGKISFPKPRGYNPDRYALLARFLNSDPKITWTLNYTTAPMTDGPVQMRKGDSNNAGSFSSDYVGGNYRWPDGTYKPGSFKELAIPRRGMPIPLHVLYEMRERSFQDHVNYQQGLMYFLANSEKVPEDLQLRVNRFGLDPSEFRNTDFWPHQLYIREGRRMVSSYVMTQANCESRDTISDGIGLGSYAMDSHFCQRVVIEKDGKLIVKNEGGFGHGCPGPYPISYRSIVPEKQECKNLLVPVCLSASHVAYGSIRMEPVFMILGQSAGTAAVMAIDQDVPVQDIPYEKLKAKLLKSGQIITATQKINN